MAIEPPSLEKYVKVRLECRIPGSMVDLHVIHIAKRLVDEDGRIRHSQKVIEKALQKLRTQPESGKFIQTADMDGNKLSLDCFFVELYQSPSLPSPPVQAPSPAAHFSAVEDAGAAIDADVEPRPIHQLNWRKIAGIIVILAGVALFGFGIIYGLGPGAAATAVLFAGMSTGAGVGALGAVIYANHSHRPVEKSDSNPAPVVESAAYLSPAASSPLLTRAATDVGTSSSAQAAPQENMGCKRPDWNGFSDRSHFVQPLAKQPLPPPPPRVQSAPLSLPLPPLT